MYKSKNIILFNDDCLNVLKKMPDNHIETAITDPPYGLSKHTTKDIIEALSAWLKGDPYLPKKSGGFMGKSWDTFVPGPELWKEVYRILKPGGYLLCFAGTRTVDLMGIAIRLGGFAINDSIDWIYGSGFPKGTNISKNLDKEAGVTRNVVGRYCDPQTGKAYYPTKHRSNPNPMDWETKGEDRWEITAPATVEAKQWEGWGTAIKPAHEPIILAMKPKEGTYAQNALEHGVAGLNISGCRIGTQEKGSRKHKGKIYTGVADGYKRPNKSSYTHKIDWEMQSGGRWPANILFSHHEECKQVGRKKIKNKSGSVSGKEPSKWTKDVYSDPTERKPFSKHADEEGNEEVEVWECHPECPIKLLNEQSGNCKTGGPGSTKKNNNSPVYSGPASSQDRLTVGYSDSGGASRFFYCAKASKKERNLGLKDKKNKHPTIKPLKIMQWLVRLTKTPTGGVVLDPFMGSGTTGIACILEGRKFIGIELEKESYDTAEERIKNIEKETPDGN